MSVCVLTVIAWKNKGSLVLQGIRIPPEGPIELLKDYFFIVSSKLSRFICIFVSFVLCMMH